MSTFDKDVLKLMRKEGGKLGADVEGQSYMGCRKFFCSTLKIPDQWGVKIPKAEPDLVIEAMVEANKPHAKYAKLATERHGGSEELAKIVFCASAEAVAVVAYVPTELQSTLKPQQWLEPLLEWYDGEVVETEKKADTMCAGLILGDGPALLEFLTHRAYEILVIEGIMDHIPDGDDWHHHQGDDLAFLPEAKRKTLQAKRVTLRQARITAADEDTPVEASEAPDAAPQTAKKAVRITDIFDKDILKLVRKEGGKLGADIEGQSNMGGRQFFCAAISFPEHPVKVPEGEVNLIVEAVFEANKDHAKKAKMAQERSGGTGHLAKIVMNACKDQVVVVAYVPRNLKDKLAAHEWLRPLLDWYEGEPVQTERLSDHMCAGIVTGDGPQLLEFLTHKAYAVLVDNGIMDHIPDGDDWQHQEGDDLAFVSAAKREGLAGKRKSLAFVQKPANGDENGETDVAAEDNTSS